MWSKTCPDRGNIDALCEMEIPMQTLLEILEAEVLKLSAGERARLAEHLIASLDEDTEIEEAWAVEVERRIAEIEGEKVQMIPAAEAIAQARASLK
jgi:putative addiction module component (TIGR02574 family)